MVRRTGFRIRMATTVQTRGIQKSTRLATDATLRTKRMTMETRM